MRGALGHHTRPLLRFVRTDLDPLLLVVDLRAPGLVLGIQSGNVTAQFLGFGRISDRETCKYGVNITAERRHDEEAQEGSQKEETCLHFNILNQDVKCQIKISLLLQPVEIQTKIILHKSDTSVQLDYVESAEFVCGSSFLVVDHSRNGKMLGLFGERSVGACAHLKLNVSPVAGGQVDTVHVFDEVMEAPSVATDILLGGVRHEGSDVVGSCRYVIESGPANPTPQAVPPLNVDGSMRSEDNSLGRGGPEDLGSKRSILNSNFLNGGSWTRDKFCHTVPQKYIFYPLIPRLNPIRLIRFIIKVNQYIY